MLILKFPVTVAVIELPRLAASTEMVLLSLTVPPSVRKESDLRDGWIVGCEASMPMMASCELVNGECPGFSF